MAWERDTIYAFLPQCAWQTHRREPNLQNTPASVKGEGGGG